MGGQCDACESHSDGGEREQSGASSDGDHSKREANASPPAVRHGCRSDGDLWTDKKRMVWNFNFAALTNTTCDGVR